MAQKYDDAIESVGDFGRFQRLVFFLGVTYATGTCLATVSFVFLSALPDHWCHVPSLSTLNLTLEQMKQLSLPPETVDGVSGYSHCKMYDVVYENLSADTALEMLQRNRTRTEIDCAFGWEYDTSQYQSSIRMDWDLVCEQRSLAALSQSVFMSGFMMGVLSMGLLADRIGRRKTQIICVVIMVLSNIISTFSVNIYMFIILRFIIAFTCIPTFTIFFVLVMELVGPKWRLFVGIGIEYFWVLGYFVIVLCAYFIRQWRYLQLAMSVPLIVYFPLVYFVFPESPRWLYSKCRRVEGDKLMKKIARVNGKDVPDKLDVVVMNPKDDVKVWSLVRFPRLRIRTLIVFLMWFVCSMVYYGLSLGTSNIGGDDYINFLISGAIEVPAYIFCQLTMDRWGRRPTTSGTMLLGGVTLLLTMAVPAKPSLNWVLVTLTTIGKFGISAAFAIAYVYTAELFPTVVRTSALGSASFCARVGGIVAPQMALLGEYSKYIPLVTYGVLSVIAGLLILYLPETSNTKMPETLEEAEQVGKKTNVIAVSALDDPVAAPIDSAGRGNPAFDGENTHM